MAENSLMDRFKKAWNVFRAEEDNPYYLPGYLYDVSLGSTSTVRNDRARLKPTNERSIVASIYNRIATDTAAIPIKHVRVDENDVYISTIDSSLNECLSLSANIDQTGRELIFDLVISMFDEGVVALVPVDTKDDLLRNNSIDILSLRTGRITQWYPRHVRIEVYNDVNGMKREILLPKDKVAIIENPFYSVMNEPNSTLKRLIHKLNLLDAVDEQSSSSKLDLIVQLPYVVKSETRQKQAEERRRMLEEQLASSKYGVGYVDSTEKITQLNRPVENNLMSQIEYLTAMLYNQLGITKDIFEGNANQETLLNYYNRMIEPILSAITMEMTRKFLTKTARTQGQAIKFYQDPFRLVPISELASIADTFTRNEILSSNELRSIIGYRPVDDPRADELRNKNLNATPEQLMNPISTVESQNGPYQEEYYEEEPYYEEDQYYE